MDKLKAVALVLGTLVIVVGGLLLVMEVGLEGRDGNWSKSKVSIPFFGNKDDSKFGVIETEGELIVHTESAACLDLGMTTEQVTECLGKAVAYSTMQSATGDMSESQEVWMFEDSVAVIFEEGLVVDYSGYTAPASDDDSYQYARGSHLPMNMPTTSSGQSERHGKRLTSGGCSGGGCN